MDTAELLKKVRKIEIKTRGLSRQLFSGEYHSAFKGRGMSFSEVRAYNFGDDVRSIDWNVTARTGIPHVKVFEEERELTVMLLVDVSQSSFFGTRNQLKQGVFTEISAVLAFSAIQNNDKVGVIFFSDQIEMFIPPKKGKQHILRIIRELIDFHPKGKGTDLSQALEYFNNLVKKRSICFILSDFMTGGYERALQVVSKKHDLIGVHITDPAEQQLPRVGLLKARDPETGQLEWVDTNVRRIRDLYASRHAEALETFRNTFARSGVDTIALGVNDDYVKALLSFFRKRR
jgi:uncharacterized protein (DUF58 family)